VGQIRRKSVGGCGVIFDPESQKYAVLKREDGHLGLFAGGVSKDEDIQQGILREVIEESGLHDFLYIEKIAEALSHFYNILKNVNRVAHATCFLVVLRSTDLIPTKLESHEKFTLAWATPSEIISDWESWNEDRGNDHWIYFFKKSVNRAIELGYDTTNFKI
jgi:8-oxo-dGTP pyrophosphatase MutT (NUDIX family)